MAEMVKFCEHMFIEHKDVKEEKEAIEEELSFPPKEDEIKYCANVE